MTRVVIANRWVSPDGKTYKANQAAEVEPGVARDLISRGIARTPDEKPAVEKAADPKPEPVKKEAQRG